MKIQFYLDLPQHQIPPLLKLLTPSRPPDLGARLHEILTKMHKEFSTRAESDYAYTDVELFIRITE